MTKPITAGTILVEESAHLPNALLLQAEADSTGAGITGWSEIKDSRATFEKALREAGWTFFFMAGEIQATVFGFDKPKALGAALKRLITDVQSQHCNSIEIGQVADKSLLGLPYVRLTAHVRHLQKGTLFQDNLPGPNSAPGLSQTQPKWKVTA